MAKTFGVGAWVLWGLASVACVMDLQAPAQGHLTCTSQSDCPSNQTCLVEVQRCVPSGNGAGPPRITSATIAPQPASAAAMLTVTFTVDAPLLLSPDVRLDTALAPRFALVHASDATYTFTLEAAQGTHGTVNVLASLASAGGAVGNALVGSVQLDFVAPTLAAPILATPSVIGTSSLGQLRIVSDEDLASAPTVTLLDANGQPLRTLSGAVTTVDARTYLISCEAQLGDPSGPIDVEVVLTDVAGNNRTITEPRAITFDLLGPTVLLGTESVRLIPSATNPLPAVSAATHHTVVEFFFALDEPAAASSEPVVNANGLTFTQTFHAGTTYIYQLTLPADSALPEGLWDVEVSAYDTQGNLGESVIEAAFDVDLTPPPAPNVDATPALYVLERAPWGDGTTQQAKLWVAVAADAAAAGSTVIVSSAAGELGRATPLPGTATTIALRSLDEESVDIQLVDAAGNLSDHNPATLDVLEASPVRAITWTATLGRKVVGSNTANPHRFESRPARGKGLTLSATTDYGANAGLGLQDTPGTTTTGAIHWRRVAKQGDAPWRLGAGAAFDPVRQRTIFGQGYGFYGGFSPPGSRATMTVRDEDGFEEFTPGDPESDGTPFVGELLVFSARDGQTLLAPADDGPTWVVENRSLRRLNVAAQQSLPSTGARAVAYDTHRAQPVMYIGGSVQRTLGWDGQAWLDLCLNAACGAELPSPNDSFATAYDQAARELLLLDGGFLWAFTSTNMWEKRCTSLECQAMQPINRRRYAMAYDSERNRTVMYGGCTAGSVGDWCTTSLTDVWEWDGASWSCLEEVPCEGFGCMGNPLNNCNRTYPSDPNNPYFHDTLPAEAPLLGANAVLLFDPERREIHLAFGQGYIQEPAHKYWRWDGTRWHKKQFAPPVAESPALASVNTPSWQGVLMFTSAGETWGFTNGEWEKFSPSCMGATCPPQGRKSAAMAFDPASAQVVMFGGNSGGTPLGDTWTWTFEGGWVLACETPGHCASSPPATSVAAGAYDGASGGVFITDGTGGWWWREGAWVSGCAMCLNNGLGAPGAVFFDSVTGRMMMRGGNGPMGADTGVYAFDAGWTFLEAREARFGLTAATDSARQVSVTYGGHRIDSSCPSCNQLCTATSEYCEGPNLFATAWSTASVWAPQGTLAPGPRGFAGAAFEPSTNTVLLHGGKSHDIFYTPQVLGDTFLLDGGATNAPLHIFSAALSAMGNLNTLTVEGFSVVAQVGAQGAASAETVEGADLWLWDGFGWRVVSTDHQGVPGATTELQWQSQTDATFGTFDANALSALAVGEDRKVVVALTPRGGGGLHPNQATLQTDFVMLQVHYRR